MIQKSIWVRSTYGVLCAATALYFLILYVFPPFKLYRNFDIFNFDFGILYQSTYLLSEFKDLFLTVRGVHAWADNQDYFQIFLAALHYLPSSAYMLLLVHSLGIYACGLFCLIHLGKTDRITALFIAVAVWSNVVLINMNLDVFHTEAFATIFILLLYAAMKKGNAPLFYGFLLLALSCKEDVALTVSWLMILAFFTRQRLTIHKTHLVIGFILSLMLLFVNINLVLPHFKEATCLNLQPEIIGQAYDSNPASASYQYIFHNWYRPGYIASVFLKPIVGWYILKIVWPFLFIVRRMTVFMLLPLPGLILNIMSASDAFRDAVFHYDHSTMAGVIIALVASITRCRKKRIIGLLLLTAAIINNLYSNDSQIPIQDPLKHRFYNFGKSAHVEFLEDLNPLLPENIVISADYKSINYLIKGHPNIYMFENPIQKSHIGFGLYGACEDFSKRPNTDFIIVWNGYEINPEMNRILSDGYRPLSDPKDLFRIWIHPSFLDCDASRPLVQWIEEVKALKNTKCKPANMLINGDFDHQSENLPSFWQLHKWKSAEECPDCKFQITSNDPKDGPVAVENIHTLKNHSRWVQQVIVKPKTRYRLSGWIRTRDIGSDGSGAFLQAEGTYNRAKYIFQPYQKLKTSLRRTKALFGTNNWVPVTVHFETGRDQLLMDIVCSLGDYGGITTGYAAFDNVKLIELTSDYCCQVFNGPPFP